MKTLVKIILTVIIVFLGTSATGQSDNELRHKSKAPGITYQGDIDPAVLIGWEKIRPTFKSCCFDKEKEPILEFLCWDMNTYCMLVEGVMIRKNPDDNGQPKYMGIHGLGMNQDVFSYFYLEDENIRLFRVDEKNCFREIKPGPDREGMLKEYLNKQVFL